MSAGAGPPDLGPVQRHVGGRLDVGALVVGAALVALGFAELGARYDATSRVELGPAACAGFGLVLLGLTVVARPRMRLCLHGLAVSDGLGTMSLAYEDIVGVYITDRRRTSRQVPVRPDLVAIVSIVVCATGLLVADPQVSRGALIGLLVSAGAVLFVPTGETHTLVGRTGLRVYVGPRLIANDEARAAVCAALGHALARAEERLARGLGYETEGGQVTATDLHAARQLLLGVEPAVVPLADVLALHGTRVVRRSPRPDEDLFVQGGLCDLVLQELLRRRGVDVSPPDGRTR